MTFEKLVARYRTKSFSRGEFDFLSGARLSSTIAEARVPHAAGAYVIYSATGDVLYIGRAGTIQQDGSLGDQGLNGRLQRKQDGVPRQQFFQEVMLARGLPSLHFTWFETYRTAEGGVPPFLGEAELLAAFLRDHGVLPALNKCA